MRGQPAIGRLDVGSRSVCWQLRLGFWVVVVAVAELVAVEFAGSVEAAEVVPQRFLS